VESARSVPRQLAGASVVLFTIPQQQRVAGLPGSSTTSTSSGSPARSDEVAANVRKTLQQRRLGTLEVVTGKKLIEENQSQIAGLGFSTPDC